MPDLAPDHYVQKLEQALFELAQRVLSVEFEVNHGKKLRSAAYALDRQNFRALESILIEAVDPR